MKYLRAILVDDERLARERMRNLLNEYPGLRVVGTAGSLPEAVALLGHASPDVVFLDISMPPANGFELLPHLEEWTQVVFVTAYSKHAVRAFKAQALDYLLKPVRPERLAQTIERVRAMAALKRRPTKVRVGEKITQDDDRHWERIPIDEIAAVTGQGNYSRIHILDGGDLAVRRTMQEWNAQLAAAGFVALTRSMLIHPAAISQLEIISRDETFVHLYGVPEPFRLGRAASLRARRCFRDRGRRKTGPGEPARPGETDVTDP